MCRNITELRGLEPPATDDEVEAAARQFVRKVSGLQKPPAGAEAAYEQAIARVTAGGFCRPDTFRMNWRAAASTSSSVAGGSRPRNSVMLRHMLRC